MRDLTNQFIEYLISIGILSYETIDDFYKINSNYMTESVEQSKEEEFDCFKESMTMSLIHYIFNLDDKRKRCLMLNIIFHFIKNTKQQIEEKLKGIILLMTHSNNQLKPHNRKDIKIIFNQWKGNTSLSSITSLHKITPIYSQPKHNQHTSPPNITGNNQSINGDYYDKLYNDHMMHTKMRDIRTIEANTLEGNKNTFIPVINNNHSSHQLTKSKSLFHIRQRDYLKYKEKRIKNRILSLETLESNECKFLPTISPYKFKRTNTANNSPVHYRLYTDFNIRNQKYIRRQKEEEDLIKNNSNHNKNISIDLSRIHLLYNEYKIKKSSQDGLTKEVDKDIGNTFHPNVSHDKYYYNINTSFYQREKEFLGNKRIVKKIDDNGFKLERKQKQVGYLSYLHKNKNEICNEVVSRLFPKYELKFKNKTSFISSSTFAHTRNGISRNSTNVNHITTIK